VPDVYALVAEILAHVVDFFHPPTMQRFKWSSVAMRRKSWRSRALEVVTKGRAAAPDAIVERTGVRLRCILSRRGIPDRPDDEGAFLEGLHDFGVHHEVEVAPPVADLGVLEAVVLSGRGSRALARRVIFFACTEISPRRVLNTYPATPIMSPRS